MIRDKVLDLIKEHREDLENFKIKSLYLFGSVARNEDRPDSDIDILVDFDGPATFDRFMDLKFFLSDLLQRKVDLVTINGIRPELKNLIAQDSIRAA